MIFQKQEDIERYWTELIYSLSNGAKTEYEALKGTEVMEFFRILKIYYRNLNRTKNNGKNKS